MTIQGAIAELQNLINADDVPFYYKGVIEKVIETIQMEIADRKTENSSEKPNNCEHITEDGVTCAKYPACDDCLDNPLNKVKGSERLVKGNDEPTISKMEQVKQRSCDTCKGKDVEGWKNPCLGCEGFTFYEPKDEPQTEREGE